MKIINGVLVKVEESDIIDGILEIPDTVTEIKEYICYENTSIREIKIPDGVRKIGPSAFYRCYSLEKVTLSKNIKKLAAELFSSCPRLKKVNLKEGVEIIGTLAFSACPRLQNISLPNSVKQIENSAFSDCINLRNVKLSENLTSIDDLAFSNNISLEKLKLPNSLQYIGEYAFQKCSFLSDVILSTGLKYLGKGAFRDCKMLNKIKIPKGIEKIEYKAFSNCRGLKNIELEYGIRTIEKNAFENCTSIKKLELPDSIEEIGFGAFANCETLKTITLSKNLKTIRSEVFLSCAWLTEIYIPGSVESIGRYAFSDCYELKKVHIEEGTKNILKAAFANCDSLEEVFLPDSIEEIGELAFSNCFNLEKIRLSNNLSTIGVKAFSDCESLKTITTSWQQIEMNSSDKETMTEDILKAYLYLYANSILKEKYQSIEEFLLNEHIKETINDFNNPFLSTNGIQKFKNLFRKLRKEYDISSCLFNSLDIKTTEQFSYSIWKKMKEMLPISCDDSEDISNAVAEIIEVFGLFQKDKNASKRLKKLESLWNPSSIVITKEMYETYLKKEFSSKIMDQYFKEGKRTYYLLDRYTEIPEEFQPYLEEYNYLFPGELKVSKRQRGNYGKRLNNFIKENYQEVILDVYEREESIKDSALRKALARVVIENGFNCYSVHNIFDGCKREFDEDFYNFFMENLPIILHNEKVQTKVKEIQKKFQSIKKYYQEQSGCSQVSLHQAIDYINNINLSYHPGNYEILRDASKAGITNQEAFDYYQDIYEKNQTRRKRALLPRSNIYEINGYVLKAELLRKDDPFTLFVGEKNYTNCCQTYGGVGHNCMAHAACSEDGGIFVIRLLKDGKWILLTESWDWQNNNLYCHDNIEGTEYLKTGSKDLKEAVAKAFRLDGEYIIKKSHEEVEEYIKIRKKAFEGLSPENKEKELKKLDQLAKNQIIKVVTSGVGYDDLGLENYFKNELKIKNDILVDGKIYTLTLRNFQPVDYNSSKPYFNSSYRAYSDADDSQYIIAGNLEDLASENEMLVPIYKDQRKILLEEKEKIRDYTKNKIFQIMEEVYNEKLRNHYTSDDYDNSTIYLGEDWYLVYENLENGNIYISDLARRKPDLEEERGIQQQEILSTLLNLINSSDEIEADLKEDTSYLLYLMNKRLGYIEQIGEDISYSLSDKRKMESVTEEKQQETINQLKKIREDKNPNLTMHKVKFKKK